MDRVIAAEVTGYQIRRGGETLGAVGTGNAVLLRFKFDAAWDGMAKTAKFTDARGDGGVTTEVELLTQNADGSYTVPVPREAMAYEGVAELTLIGEITESGAVVKRLTTKPLPLRVYESGADREAQNTQPITATDKQQILGKVNVAEAYAKGTVDGVPVAEGETGWHDNAKHYCENAASSAQNAASHEAAALGYKNAAATQAQSAKSLAESSRSYAVGDTETREGEETDNAKYYSEQAAAAASEAAEDAVTAAAAELQEYTEAASESASAAETAQEKAEDAQTAAETAQGKAEDAQSAAEDAQSAAEDAAASLYEAESLIEDLDAHRYDAFATETQTDVATFETDIGADGVPVKALSVGIEAVQDISEVDPTPDVRIPIIGFTAVTLTWNGAARTITLPSISFNGVSQDACYGGSINILTGVLSVEWIKFNLWRGNWTRGGASSNYCEATSFHDGTIDVRTDVARAPSIWSASGFVKGNTYRNAASSALYNGTGDFLIELRQGSGSQNSSLWLRDTEAPTETAPGDTYYYQTMNRYLESIGAYCIAKLAAPKTYQLDPSTVSTLLGTNTASALLENNDRAVTNSGKLTVTFRVDPTLAYDELKAAIIAAGTT